jgi:adenylate cyclase
LPETPPLPLPDKPSIAVLPFDNMSGDPKQDFFSDGITEEIISALSRVSGLFVIARNSSFTYKGKSVSVLDVARDLGVQYVLEGSVRRAGDRVRVTAQRIDGKTNNHIWSETYDRELKDIFAVQDEITMKILTSVKVKLTGGEDSIVPLAKRATNLQAYLKILEGLARMDESRFSEAKRLYEEALSLDPKSPAYAGLALNYLMDVFFGPPATRAKALAKALEYGEKCLDQDETNEVCHRNLCYAYTLKRDYEKALQHGRRAIELNPNSAFAASFLSFALRSVGEYEEAVRQCERAMRLDPRNYMPFFQIGATYVMMNRHEEAIQALSKAVKMNPKHMPSWLVLVMAYSSLDRMEEARAVAAEVLKQSPNFSVDSFVKALPYKDEEPRQFMADALRKAGLK